MLLKLFAKQTKMGREKERGEQALTADNCTEDNELFIILESPEGL